MHLAQALIRDSEYAVECAIARREKEKAIELFDYFRVMKKMREQNRSSRALEIWLIFIFLGLEPVASIGHKNQYRMVV
jgi:hypothetical protein